MADTRWRTHLFGSVLALAVSLSLAPAAQAQEALGSQVNALVALDFSGDYITPRGLHVEGQGLVAQPLLLLLWKLHSSQQGPMSDVTLTTGLWNSFHSHRAGSNPSRWNEVDPILGIGFKLRKGLSVDVSTSAFYTPTNNYATSTNAEFKLTYSDSWSRKLTLNPYAAYWVELHNKATVMFNSETSKEGSYLAIGVTPTLALGGSGATLAVAASANIVSSSFYQRFDGSDGGAGLAVVSIAPKISMPLKRFGVSHGAWTVYASVNYFHLSNEGLLDGNQVLRPAGDRPSNLTQVRGGLTVFF